jgi:RNA polymerase sigma factor (TIGR02999 family)
LTGSALSELLSPFILQTVGRTALTSKTIEFHKLLEELKQGDSQAKSKLVELVYDDLRRLASAQLGRGASKRTLDTTSLVHECYLRIIDPIRDDVEVSSSAKRDRPICESKNHFFNMASKVMRQVLCDYARERLAEKRGGGAAHVTLSAVDHELQEEAAALIELDELLNKLQVLHPSYARVFECRYFAGMSEQETADALNTSLRTAQREWNLARQWLAQKIA